MLIRGNLPVRKIYFNSNIIARIVRRFFLRIILKRTSTEAHVYMRGHQGTIVEHFDVSNVIYHKFSHRAVSYTLNGENVKVMLESLIEVQEYSFGHIPYFIIHLNSYCLKLLLSQSKFSGSSPRFKSC